MSSTNSQIRISDLHTRIDHLERELRQTRELLARENHDSASGAETERKTRLMPIARRWAARSHSAVAAINLCVLIGVPLPAHCRLDTELVQHQKRLSCTVPSSAASGKAQLAPLRRP